MRRLLRRLARLIAWSPILWNNGSEFDWSSIYAVMEFQIRRIRKHIKKHDILVAADCIARRMLVAEQLCHRIRLEDYCLSTPEIGPWGKELRDASYESYMHDQDVEMLGRYLMKYSRGWWD